MQYEVMSALVKARSLEQAAVPVLEAIGSALGWQVGVFWLLEPQSAELRPVALWQARAVAAPAFTAETQGLRLHAGQCLPGRAWAKRAPVAVADLSREPDFLRAQSASAGGLQAGLFFPIIATGDEVHGVLELLSLDAHLPPAPDLTATLETLGRQVGQYIERLRAEEALRQAEKRFRDGLEAAVADRTRELEREIAERARVETALRASEAKLRRLYQSDVIGIIVSDFTGHIREANDAFLRLLGYSRTQLEAGALRWDLLTPPEWIPRDMSAVTELKSAGVVRTYEKEYLHADGTRVPILIGGALIGGDDCILFVLDNTPRKRAEQALAHLNQELDTRVRARTESLMKSEARADQTACALARSEQRLRALTAHLQTVREEERVQLAREIHDVVGQELTGFRLDVAWLLRRLTDRPPPTTEALVERLSRMQELIDSSILTVRRIATELRPGVLDDLGLVAALEWQAREFQRRSGVEIHLAGMDEELSMERPRATAVFRIFQELLTNVARHAGAQNVDVRVERTPTTFILEVRDDGRGITEAEVSDLRSLGLMGLRERALAAGGTINITGVRGSGTVARLRIPLSARNEESKA
jgi:PAS domain S-box-containing protein